MNRHEKELVSTLREVVGDQIGGDDDFIFAVLKECDMNPDVASEKLLLALDGFEEVKGKRQRKKEKAKEKLQASIEYTVPLGQDEDTSHTRELTVTATNLNEDNKTTPEEEEEAFDGKTDNNKAFRFGSNLPPPTFGGVHFLTEPLEQPSAGPASPRTFADVIRNSNNQLPIRSISDSETRLAAQRSDVEQTVTEQMPVTSRQSTVSETRGAVDGIESVKIKNECQEGKREDRGPMSEQKTESATPSTDTISDLHGKLLLVESNLKKASDPTESSSATGGSSRPQPLPYFQNQTRPWHSSAPLIHVNPIPREGPSYIDDVINRLIDNLQQFRAPQDNLSSASAGARAVNNRRGNNLLQRHSPLTDGYEHSLFYFATYGHYLKLTPEEREHLQRQLRGDLDDSSQSGSA